MWKLITNTWANWNRHNAQRMGAALAFYSLLALAPLVVIAIALGGEIFGRSAAQNHLIEQVRQLVGPDGARVIQSLAHQAQNRPHQAAASLLGILTLLFGASGVFSELRSSLNTIWQTQPKEENEAIAFLRDRLLSMGIVLAVGFLLVVSLVASTVLAGLGKYFTDALPVPPWMLEIVNFLISFVGLSLVFGLIFRFVGDAKIPWRDVWVGSVVTALLFTVGKMLIGLYLGRAAVGSAYGASGSLVVVVVWVYYSAQIFLLGAEFVHEYAQWDYTAHHRRLPSSPLPAAPKPG